MLRNKLLSLIALLVISAGALFMPLTAYAAELPEETEPSATIEAIDGNLEVDSGETAGLTNMDELSVGGMDDFMTMLELFSMFGVDPGEPAMPQSPKAFTPDGQATVTDWATEYDGKEFYTFTTPAGNVFFLIIDHARNNDNVYFLNTVTESDLISLAEKAGEPISAIAVPVVDPPRDPDGNDPGTGKQAGGTTETPAEETGGGNTGMIIFVVIAVLAIGGAGYYIKIVRPKQQSAGIDDDDEDEPEDDDDDIPFADETEEPDGDQAENDDDSDGDFNDSDDDIDESDDGREDEDE